MSKVIPLPRRPLPPAGLLEDHEERFVAAPDLAAWATCTFIAEDAVLANEDHAHLRHVNIGFLWTNVANERQMRRIVGQAELGDPQGAMGKWAKARARVQVMSWFGQIPGFIITIDAHFAAEAGDATFCALIEHELYHCSQERDQYGMPKFSRNGQPIPAMRGHDVEEFVGVVRRYGAQAAGVTAMVQAANRGPEVAAAGIAHACGTCQRQVA